jgi:hypothetical protein
VIHIYFQSPSFVFERIIPSSPVNPVLTVAEVMPPLTSSIWQPPRNC